MGFRPTSLLSMSRFAFLFPGQGSQSVGMMAAYGDLAAIRDTFAEASDALGQDLWRLAAEGPAEELNKTVNTQPAMLAAGSVEISGSALLTVVRRISPSASVPMAK